MSRHDPNTQSANPCKFWFNFDGSKGDIRYYDKETETDVHLPLPFWFILLDRMAVIKGWHDASESGITSNEVRSTLNEEFTVRAFKMKEPIARGFYADIKDKVKASGGRFNTNLYIAFNGPFDQLEIGSLMLHGGSLRAWMEFEKANKKELYQKAIRIPKFEEGKKGGITYKTPVFETVELEGEMDERASQLQKEIKDYLDKYLARGQQFHDPTLQKLTEAKAEDLEEDVIPF